MSIADVVTVNITSTSASPTQAGFGTALLCCYHAIGSQRVTAYSASTALTSMVSDGHLTTSVPYIMASLVLAQNPSVRSIKLGKRVLAYSQTVTFQCLDATTGAVYTIDCNGTTVTYTVPGASTTTTVATALAALIDALALITATSSTDTITVTTTLAGSLTHYANWSNNLVFKDTTADPGLATDLAAIAAEDNDWYGLTLDTSSAANVTAAAAYAESNEKLFAQHTNDTITAGNKTSTHISATQKALAHARTYLQFQGTDSFSYSGAAMLGNRLPMAPGSDTWALKTLSGITVDNARSLTPTQEGYLIANNCSTYTIIAGLNTTTGGKTPSGEYADIIRGRDWLKSTIQTRTFGYIKGQEKVPYTDLGTESIASAGVRTSLADAIRVSFLAADPAPVVTVTPVADVAGSAKAARTYGGISWTATLAGAIHAVTIGGTVSV